MSGSQDIKPRLEDDLVAPTPQNTPLTTGVLTSRPAGLGKPHVEDVAEDEEEDGEDVSGANPASLLASVSRNFCSFGIKFLPSTNRIISACLFCCLVPSPVMAGFFCFPAKLWVAYAPPS
jgi:hypothetical protein